MLILARSLKELRFAELAEVYSEFLREASTQWRNYPQGFALEMAEGDLRQYLQEVFFPTAGAMYALWEVNGRYVSALRLEPYRDGLLLEALETAPDQRNKGYAASLIGAVLAALSEQGRDKVYSHVHKHNAASRKAHEKCGFRVISDCAVYMDGSVDYRCSTLLYE